ncbi:oxidoreductase [Setomelanomma holmii]|uniref:Oxidoreductase n=1 Tax=Setomelanomma holmii TaxID=210430 RepID=A0A9P4LNM4_9PLEO|nr:oxidoreductase [Setomelanomma holmii]
MSATPTNRAAWMLSPKQRLQVDEAPYSTPKSDEIIIKNRAIAINPIDWVVQEQGTALAFGWIKYPYIFGCDVAGSVVSIGSAVTRFKIGDRVVGQALSTVPKIGTAAHGGFQLYPTLLEQNTVRVPDNVGFEEACAMPLGLATAAAGLFEKEQLGLGYPSLSPKPTGKTLLVWGGSTSVGLNAIQLGVATGYEVIATSSPKNFKLLKSLGAREVFDYNDARVVEKIVSAMKERISAGAIAMGENSAVRCLDVLSRCQGDRRIAMATFPIPQNPGRFALLKIILALLKAVFTIFVRSKLRGIKLSIVFGSIWNSPVGDAVYGDFLPEALASGKFQILPEPVVVGEGLESVQAGMEMQKKGVSAKKIVVALK